jgi:hypothetical protein
MKAMKTGITTILMFLCLAGCQQKSEIDKCVEALATQECMNSSNKKTCINEITDVVGGLYRLKCLKAQAGKE